MTVVPLLLGLAACLYWSRAEVIDDAFISFRYAQNLVAGHGLVYNVGERVEGYTNFLWVILLAAAASMGADLAQASQVMGAAFALLTIFTLSRFPPDAGDRPWARLFAPALLALSPPFSMWAVHGLETAMFSFLVLAGIRSDLHADARDRVPRGSAIWYALATLTRPEGLIFFVTSAACWIPAAPRRWWSLAGVRHVAVFAAIVGSHVAWRIAYYGDVLPNTAYAKVGVSAAAFGRGIEYVAGLFTLAGAPLFLLAIPAVMAARSSPALRFLVIVFAVFLLAVAAEGGDAFVAVRLLVPVLPVLYLLIQEGCVLIMPRARVPAWVAIATFGIFALLHVGSRFEEARIEADAATSYGNWLRQVGLTLGRSFPPDTTIALNPAGAVPYYSGFRAYDMLGLTDRHIARRAVVEVGRGQAGHEKGDGKYILARRPHLILMANVEPLDEPPQAGSPMKLRAVHLSQREIAGDPDLPRLYASDALEIEDGMWLAFFRRRDVAPPVAR